MLYLKGNINLLNNFSIAIIGSRSCTKNGKNLAQKFSSELSQCGITIVSGLALGIDTFAHLSSYDKLGKTIAILGCGFNHIFPEENTYLFNKIIENGGLVVSEYPPDTKYKSNYFLDRNRIVSGLSLGVLVVEAAYRSGTSVTARLAEEQERKVFALPHEIYDSHGVGTNRLLKNGAILVTCIDDILSEFNLLKLKENLCSNPDIINSSTANFNSIYSNTTNLNSINSDTANLNSIYSNTTNLNSINSDTANSTNSSNVLQSSKYADFIKLFSSSPISINTLCRKTSKSVNEISTILLNLELDGFIKKVSGGYICTLNN